MIKVWIPKIWVRFLTKNLGSVSENSALVFLIKIWVWGPKSRDLYFVRGYFFKLIVCDCYNSFSRIIIIIMSEMVSETLKVFVQNSASRCVWGSNKHFYPLRLLIKQRIPIRLVLEVWLSAIVKIYLLMNIHYLGPDFVSK